MIKCIKYCAVILWSVIFAQFAYANTASSDLSTLLNGVHTMKADFNQIIYDNRGKAIHQSNGHMAMDRPGKFRWEISKPIPQLLIANQSRLWIYDPDLEQVTIRTLHHITGETPALLLSHTENVLDKEFTVSELKPTPKIRRFNLTPKKNDNNFASIQLAFMQQQIYEMRLQDHLGHSTQIQFKNTKINMPISTAMFVFKTPAKVDVIHEKSS